MATFYFVLGMVTVLVIAEVVAAFFVIKTINSLKEQARDAERQLSAHSNDVHHRIDSVWQDTEQHFQEVYRQLDSRLDKLETKLTKQVIKG